MSNYLQIKYRNSCDLAGSVFQQPETAFHYVMYLDADIGEPTYEPIEEGVEDGEKNFIANFKKLTKKYTFHTVVPEYQLDALCSIMLHNTVFIRAKNGERSRVYNFNVQPGEWLSHGAMNKVTISFTVRYDIVTGCCNNEKIIYRPCLTCNTRITSVNIVDVNDTTQWTDRTYVMKGLTDLLTGEMSNYTLYYYRYKSGFTVYTGRNYELICFTYLGSYYEFYYLNGYWHFHRVIRSAVAVGSDVTVRCWSAPNLFAQLYKSFGGGPYTAVGSPVLSSIMENVGVTAPSCAAGNNSFKVQLYDNNCNYGYSNIVVVAV